MDERSESKISPKEERCKKKNSGERSMYPGPFFTPNNPPARGRVLDNVIKRKDPDSASPQKS